MSMLTKLYELTDAYKKVSEMLENEEIDNQVIYDTLESLEADITEKVENIAKLIRALEAEAEIIRREEQRLSQRRRTIENKIEFLKNYTKDELIKAGIDKVKGKIFTVSIQPNPPSVEIIDIETFMKSGEKYLIPQEPKIDKRALMEDLKAGIVVPGAILKQEKGLRIR